MKKKRIILCTSILIGILLIIAVLFLNSETFQRKRFASLGKKFTLADNRSWEERTDLIFPQKVISNMKNNTEDDQYQSSIDYFYNYYERLNRRCEIRNYKVTSIQKGELDELDTWLSYHFIWFGDLKIKELYNMTATMEVRYRCDYGEEDISYIERYIDDEPFCYNGYWSEWREETHSYAMYRVGLKWFVIPNDNEEDGSS